MKILIFLGLCLVASAFAEEENLLDGPSVDLPSLPSKEDIIEILKKFDPLEKDVLSLKLPNADPSMYPPFELDLKKLALKGVGGADPDLKLKLVFLPPKPTEATKDLGAPRKSDLGYKITFKINFNEILKASSDYTVSGNLAGALDLYGNGKINADIEGLVVDLMVQLRTIYPETKKWVAFDDFHATATMSDKTKIKITGLQNDEELSKVASMKLPGVIIRSLKDFEKDINAFLKPKLQKLYEDNIGDVTIDELAKKIEEILHPKTTTTAPTTRVTEL